MNILIRNETPDDLRIIDSILLAAFPGDGECKVVNALRHNGNAVISLVAEANKKVIGHILFSRVSTHPLTPEKGIGLAPVSVLPEYQSQGIGSLLVRAGLQACRDLQFDYCVVLGSPKYYARFGFEKASSFNLQNEYGVDDEFMVIQFEHLPAGGGLVTYSSEFSLFSV